MKIIEEDTLWKVVGEGEGLAAVEVAFRALAEGRVIQPAPLGMDLPEVRGGGSRKRGFPER